MLQRQQTVWLIVATAFACMGFAFPFYSGTKQVIERTMDGVDLSAGTTFPLLISTGFTAAVAAITIVLYKNRKMQFRVCLAGLLLSFAVLFFYFQAIKNYDRGHILLTSLFSFALPVCFFMAARGIRHDEKLVKSLDKIR